MDCGFCNLEKDQSEFELHSNGKYRKQCKSCVSDRRAAYYQKNKECIKVKTREYTQNHLEQSNIHKKNWVLHNLDKRRDVNRASELRRRAAKRMLPFERFSTSDIVEKWGNVCVYCGGNFDHIDHYIPLSKGGHHSLENVRPSCISCNLRKGSKMPEDFDRQVNFG